MGTRVQRLVLGFAAAAFSAAGMASQPLTAQQGSTSPVPSTPRAVDLDSLNRSVDACTDFYQFACGGWLAKNPIPADRPRWGRFDELQDRNLEVMRRVLDQASNGRDEKTKKIGDYYATCMDETTIER